MITTELQPAQAPTAGLDAPRILAAALFAAERHRDQRRKDAAATPYINHPLALASLLAGHGVADADVLCAALLHDTIEDTETRTEELESRFGPRVRALVEAITDDKALPWQDRKRLQVEHAAGGMDPGAKLVKLADKICNLRDLATNPPPRWDDARRRKYFDWAAEVVSGLRGTHAELEAVFDTIYAKGPAPYDAAMAAGPLPASAVDEGR